MNKAAYQAIRNLPVQGKGWKTAKFGSFLIEVGLATFKDASLEPSYNCAMGKVRDFIDPERLALVWEEIEPNDEGLIELDLRLLPKSPESYDPPTYITVYVIGDLTFRDELPAALGSPLSRAVYLATNRTAKTGAAATR